MSLVPKKQKKKVLTKLSLIDVDDEQVINWVINVPKLYNDFKKQYPHDINNEWIEEYVDDNREYLTKLINEEGQNLYKINENKLYKKKEKQSERKSINKESRGKTSIAVPESLKTQLVDLSSRLQDNWSERSILIKEAKQIFSDELSFPNEQINKVHPSFKDKLYRFTGELTCIWLKNYINRYLETYS